MKRLTASIFVLSTLGAHAALNFTLPGTSERETWDNLNSSTYNSLNGFTGSYGNPTAAWPAPIAGSTGNAVFDKTSGGGYFSSSSIYNAGVAGSFSVSSSSVLPSIATLVFQIDTGSASALDGTPILTINGSTQIAPSFNSLNDGAYSTFDYASGTSFPTTISSWQWDLTGETVSSWEITFDTTPHATIYELNVDSGTSFTQVIPEPSSVLVSFLSVALLLRRKRN